ncbi:type II secretion system protein J precursor [Roseovarius sp. A-2]|uniref:type II secretion system protein GspJ n=1 Tax=Roseovarius sp. A-2 TaxID=1570360 RepID=UPI0009B56AF3|nr:type II secretion system protein GspJ [Roseovarius sp. A-2]GAW33310.1 type II secretion system protein J precursor [Roseovarius sp. A-2]
MNRAVSDRGLTLLELVAVMAIFALVAVMGLQALSGMMRARDRLSVADEEAAALARGLTLLRADLKSATGASFWPSETPDPQPPLLDRSAEDGWLAFTTAGRVVLPEALLAGQERVIWRHDRQDERLTRRVWPVLRPASAQALAPETEVFDRIAGFRVRSYAGPEEGWIDGWGQPNPLARTTLPKAVEVRIDSERYGPLRVMVAWP